MFIWERLRVNTDVVDKMTVYYVIMDAKRNRFELYLPDTDESRDIIEQKLFYADNKAGAVLDFYLTLLKTYREERANIFYEKSRPAFFIQYTIPLTDFRAEQKQRRLKGERSRLRELP